MATQAQITANRANALKSTGPRSPEGKSASRFNALKHGLDADSLVLARREAETADEAALEAILNAPLPGSPYPPSASFPAMPPIPALRPVEPLGNPALRL